MKLITFNQETTPKLEKNGTAKISFSKAGTIYLNKFAVTLMQLKEGDKIAISQDEENPSDWYISKDEKGFPLRANSKKDCLMLNHSDLIRTYKSAFGMDFKLTYSCLIAGEATKVGKVNYWCILNNNNI